LIALNPDRAFAIGVDFGRTHIRVALANLGLDLRPDADNPLTSLPYYRPHIDVPGDAEGALAAAKQMIDQLIHQAGVSRSQIVGGGIGLPGPVDHSDDRAAVKELLPGWARLGRLRDAIGSHLELPVEIDNDANLGALGEAFRGAGRGCDNFIYVKASHGIGCGLYMGGRIFHGRRGIAGEIGHTIINDTGVVCYCGNTGCLRTVVAEEAILESLRLHGNFNSLDEVIDGANQGDQRCVGALTNASRQLGLTLASLCNVLDPERVIVGGSWGRVGRAEVVIEPIARAVERFGLKNEQSADSTVAVVPGELGDLAPIWGALVLVVHGNFESLRARLNRLLIN
jgi:predicted NBD/HSP70 family sugar kinase